MKGNKGFTLIELVMIIVILGILSVVAIPRYIDMQKEAQQAAAEGYIGAVSSALTTHVADHYLRDTKWVANAKAATALLEAGSTMPEGMKLKGDTWTVDGMDEQFKFQAATDTTPPAIVRFTPEEEKKE